MHGDQGISSMSPSEMPSISLGSISGIWGPLVRLGWLSSKSLASSWLLLPPIELQAHQSHQAGILICGCDSAQMLGDSTFLSPPLPLFLHGAGSSGPPVFPNPTYQNSLEQMCPLLSLQEPCLSLHSQLVTEMPVLSVLSPDSVDSLSGLGDCKLVARHIFFFFLINSFLRHVFCVVLAILELTL